MLLTQAYFILLKISKVKCLQKYKWNKKYNNVNIKTLYFMFYIYIYTLYNNEA